MSELQQWINSYLIKWGLVHDSANIWDNLVVLLLLIVITVGIDYTCRYIFLELFKRFAQKTKNQWDDLIVERKIINKLMHLIPAILVYIMLPLALPKEEMPTLLGVLQMVCSVYIVAVVLRFINASLNLLLEIYNRKESMKNKPLKGFVQIISGNCVLCRWNNHYQYPDRQIARYVICRTGCFGCHPNAGVQGYDTWLCGRYSAISQ